MLAITRYLLADYARDTDRPIIETWTHSQPHRTLPMPSSTTSVSCAGCCRSRRGSALPSWSPVSPSLMQRVAMSPSFQTILAALQRNGLEFAVVGGVAAVLHGAPVTTFDLDTLVGRVHDRCQPNWKRRRFAFRRTACKGPKVIPAGALLSGQTSDHRAPGRARGRCQRNQRRWRLGSRRTACKGPSGTPA